LQRETARNLKTTWLETKQANVGKWQSLSKCNAAKTSVYEVETDLE
jgi:hypothetical protein